MNTPTKQLFPDKGLSPNKGLFSNEALKKLILPLVLEQTLLITVGMADTMMVSVAGEAAVSGVSLVDMLNNLIISVLTALATGGTVVTSQFLGAGRKQDACRSAKQLIYTNTLITIGIAILTILFSGQLLRLLFGSIEADVFDNAMQYLFVSALYYPCLAVYNSSAALFRAMGNSRVTLKVSILMNIINVGGNAFCMFILHMGVLGVAIPSLVSRTVAAVVLFRLLKNPSLTIHIERERFRFNPSLVGKILYIGIPSGIENGIFQFGRVIVVSIISGFGTTQIAANGIANSLDSLGCIMGQAMNLAMITVIGQCVGAGSVPQVRYYTRKLLLITYLGTAIINLPMLLCLPWILKLYAASAETIALSYTLVLIHNGFATLLWPLSFVLPNMLRACNDVRFTMVVSIFSMFTFRIGFSYLIGVSMGYGAIGVWIAMIIDWIFRIICFVTRYFRGHWKQTAHLS